MCGRFTLSTPTDILARLFEVDGITLPELPARYNIAPTQSVATVRHSDGAGGRELVLTRWGLIPAWAKDADIGARMINARAETVAEKPAFRAAFQKRRCLLPADGFYEWRKDGAVKQPFYFRARDGGPLALAGLWERWRSPTGDHIETSTIITTEANDVVRAVHPRMPVIVQPGDFGAWLDPSVDAREPLLASLAPAADDSLVGYPVSRRVNSPASDDAGLVEPMG